MMPDLIRGTDRDKAAAAASTVLADVGLGARLHTGRASSQAGSSSALPWLVRSC